MTGTTTGQPAGCPQQIPMRSKCPGRLGRQCSLPMATSRQASWPPASSSSGPSAHPRVHSLRATPSAGEMTDRGQPCPPLSHRPQYPLWLPPVLGEPCGLSTFPQRRRLLIAPLDRGPPAAAPYPRHSLPGPRWSLVRGNKVVPSFWLGWSLLRGKRQSLNFPRPVELPGRGAESSAGA